MGLSTRQAVGIGIVYGIALAACAGAFLSLII